MIAFEHDSWPRWMVEAVQVLVEMALFSEDRAFTSGVTWTVVDISALEPGEGRRLGQVVAYLARLGAIRRVGMCYSKQATGRTPGNFKLVWTVANNRTARNLWDGQVRLEPDVVNSQSAFLERRCSCPR